jgi:signal transduction histidine kinase
MKTRILATIIILTIIVSSQINSQSRLVLEKKYFYLDSIIKLNLENQPEKYLLSVNEQIKIADIIGNDSLIFVAALNKLIILNSLGLFDQSLFILYQQLSILEKKPHEANKSTAYYYLGASYFQMSDHAKALDCYLKAKKAAIMSKKYIDTIKINLEIGLEYVALNKHKKGLEILKKNIILAKKLYDEEIIGIGLDNLSNSFAEIGDYENSLKYQLELYNYPRFLDSSLVTKVAHREHLSEIYIQLKKYDIAQKYVTQATKYAKELGSNDWLFDCYRNQSEIYEAKGDLKNALLFHQKFVSTKDSVYKKDYDVKMSAMANLYELEHKENQIEKLTFFKKLASAKIERLYLLSLVLVLFLGLFAAYYYYKKINAEKILQQQISHRLLQAQEDERQRISKELHDSVGQNILFLKNQLFAEVLDKAKLINTTDAALEEIRNISKNLYPNQLEKYGLIAAVDALAEEVKDASGIFVSSDMHGIDAVLNKNVKINFYRIIQEFVNNTIKHAEATSIRITAYQMEGNIVLTVQDNGKGFDKNELENKSNRSFGLINMEERVKMLKGKLSIESEPGKGTKSVFSIPV